MSKKTFKLNLAIVRALALTLFSLTISLSLPAQAAQHALAVDYLQGEGDVQGIKLAYQHNVGWLEALHPDLSLALEASVNVWRYGPANQHDSNFVLALSPVLRYPLGQAFDLRWDLEFGIGVSLLDDTVFAGKNVSTHYQFEDRLGLTAWLDSHQSLTLRFLHYSNAGFKKPNPGLDFISLSYGWHF